MDEILPIFPLGLVLLPGEPEQLRIFEPRYKQMLDDCVLDDRPFGICLMDEASDHPEEILKGWSAPRRIGCEARIIAHQESGTNHLIAVEGGRRFRIDRLLPPALPPSDDGEIFSDLEGMLMSIPEGEDDRLYLRAEVTWIEDLDVPSTGTLAQLKDGLHGHLTSIGDRLGMDADLVERWVEERLIEVFVEASLTLPLCARMTLLDVEERYAYLERNDVEEAARLVLDSMDQFLDSRL